MSDLHLEFNDSVDTFTIPETDSDVIVLAGDIGLTKSNYFDWVLKQTEGKQAIMLCGNHESYIDTLDRVLVAWRDALRGSHVHFLENDTVVIDGVNFIGATLWTDFSLMGKENRQEAMDAAEYGMNDYRSIKTNKNNLSYDKRWKMPSLTPLDVLQSFQESYKYFEDEMLRIEKKDPNHKTVIVSHHAPCPKSITSFRYHEILKCAYATELSPFMLRYKPKAWLHGHNHENADYMVGDTRVLANPRGYDPDMLNPNFKPSFVFEI